MDFLRLADDADCRRRASYYLVHDERMCELAVGKELHYRHNPAARLLGHDHAVLCRDARDAAHDERLHLCEKSAFVNWPDEPLLLEALDENRRHRTRGADMFTCAAADAHRLVHHGEALDDVYCADGTLARTCRALDAVGSADADVLFPYRVTHVDVLSRETRNPVDCASRADMAAGVVAAKETVAAPKVHLGLAEALEVRRSREAVALAVRDAKPAGDALHVEDLAICGPWRQDGRRAFGNAGERYGSVAAVSRLVEGLCRGENGYALERLAACQVRQVASNFMRNANRIWTDGIQPVAGAEKNVQTGGGGVAERPVGGAMARQGAPRLRRQGRGQEENRDMPWAAYEHLCGCRLTGLSALARGKLQDTFDVLACAETVLDETAYIGEYLDFDYGEPNLEIAKSEEGKYVVQIGIPMLTSLDDGVGELTDEGLKFTATDAAGNPISGVITLEGETASVTFTDSTWELLESGSVFNYTKSSDTPNIWSD